ncbi:YfgM family protein [Microbulbifer yueqingensis]|uniref:Ancillary SecYEG translocon subunit n=1 Tax=Microbulbifer yueqingensis TaxID=658219 RepID=A0A1G8WYF1_9GAMM|nr:tetratricopeptide repeat protein [Microbulbifer yueqingensis]SDJ83428.1 Putative negative regulator of RcsB-dependent stress response [Microbulbifer yueqingensis]
MADHITEEEQIETLKRWWAENGKGIVTGVVLALAGYFGYQFWQGNERASAEEASDLYQGFLQAVSANQGEPDNKQLTTANSLARQLKDEFGDRIYASQAALHLAALAADDNDLEEAEKQLQWVLDNASETSLELVAKRRLAAVKSARGKSEEALKLLEGDVPEAFAALYAETRGDILLQRGDEPAARSAYEEALALLLPEQAGSAQLLRLKAESIGATATGADTGTEAAAEQEESESKPAQESDEQ